MPQHQHLLVAEELIRKFAESSNETAGEHFTPREVIRLMVSLLFVNDDALASGGVVRSVYDPTAGTGGMLSVSDEHLRALNPKAKLVMFGQEINPASYAICKADMVIKGQDVDNIVRGDTLTCNTGVRDVAPTRSRCELHPGRPPVVAHTLTVGPHTWRLRAWPAECYPRAVAIDTESGRTFR